MNKRTDTSYLGSLGSGAVTGVAMAVQTGLAAVVGIIVARDFGRTAVTDGFFAAYGGLRRRVLAANAIRVTVLPPFARARGESRLGVRGGRVLADARVAFAVPLLVLGVIAADQIADLLTGGHGGSRATPPPGALPWMLLAATFQLFAGLAASALAALDDYVTSAAGFVAREPRRTGLILVPRRRRRHDGALARGWR